MCRKHTALSRGPQSERERNRQNRTEQLALHEEKKRFIADWVAANGTDEQKSARRRGPSDGRGD